MLRILPLGGLGEVGMNCMAFEQRGQIILVDCGVTFDDRGLGVDVVHPDFSPLERLGGELVGVVLTHGHEDHLGAVSYLLQRYDVPVYGPPYALGLLGARAEEHEVLRHARLVPTTPGTPFSVGSFRVEPIRVTHSIADATSLALRTDAGLVIHTGDFKIDPAPPDGQEFDAARFAELGDEGVNLLFSDSTNVDAPGHAGSEKGVGEGLERIIESAEGAVVVALFASNAHRLRMLADIARRTSRKLLLLGRSVKTHGKVAVDTGYVGRMSDVIVGESHAAALPGRSILALATGTQGEARAALARLARGEHRALTLGPGDTVILSSRTIPGHERSVGALIDALLRNHVSVRTRNTDGDVHVSGHAHRGEQLRMLELVRPRAFVPVHGTLRHLRTHAAVARSAGVARTEVIENGQLLRLSPDGTLERGEALGAGRVHRAFGREVSVDTLRQRAALAEYGVVSLHVELSPEGHPAGARVESLGVAAPDEGEVAARLADEVLEELRSLWGPHLDEAERRERARWAVRRVFGRFVGSKPLTLVHFSSGP